MNIHTLVLSGICIVHVHDMLFLVSGSKSGAGIDDDSISGDEPLSLSPPAPRVRSTKPGGTVMSKFEVHVQILSQSHPCYFKQTQVWPLRRGALGVGAKEEVC